MPTDPTHPPYEPPKLTPLSPTDAKLLAGVPKPGVKTSEFWFSTVAAVLPWLIPAIPPPVRAVLTVAAGAVYTIARSIVKAAKK